MTLLSRTNNLSAKYQLMHAEIDLLRKFSVKVWLYSILMSLELEISCQLFSWDRLPILRQT